MSGQPNILFILADDLGYGDLSAVNGGLSDTPVLDNFLSQSVSLTQQYASSPVCNPSRASLMTGRYPHRTGSIDTLEWRGLERLALDETTLADLLSRGGYRTAHIGKWHLGAFDNRYAPLSRGFDESVCFRGGGHDYFDWRIEYNNIPQHSDGRYLTDVWTDEAIGFLGRVPKDQPFFLNLCYNAPHVPLQVPEEEADIFRAKGLFSEDVCKLYGMIRRMDSGIGRVLEALKANGQYENTIVIFTSDHGYHLGEHDFWAKVSLREESAAVPLIICMPNQVPGVCNSLVELLDLYPTVADLCGLKVPQRLQGKNIKSMLSNPEATVRESAFSVAPMRKGFLLRENNWAYIQYGEDAANGIELYDMNLDPKQYNNVAKDPVHAPLINRFKAKMKLKMTEIRTNDLPKTNKQKKRKKQPKK